MTRASHVADGSALEQRATHGSGPSSLSSQAVTRATHVAEGSAPEQRATHVADEAHSSQSGRTAGQLKAVLMGAVTGENGNAEETPAESGEEILASAEDLLNAAVEARRAAPNLSYYAFTATPKPKTLELFGRLPNPAAPASKTNKPQPFHIYSMRQAIEEGYILDVLRNYTSYKVAYQLARRIDKADSEVESKKAKAKLGQWVRLHDYNIAQKVMVIVEHFRATVMGLLNGQAKAMVVTGSRKEAVRFKLEFDKYIATGFQRVVLDLLQAMKASAAAG